MTLRAVLTAMCATTVVIAGCTTTVDGAALPAATLGHATTATIARPAPSTVPASLLEGALLTREELVALVGGTNLALVGTITNTSDASKVVDDQTCLGLGSIGDAAVYSNSGWVAMRGNQFTSPNVVQADVTQLVTSFTAPADAAALVRRASENWQGCANGRYGFHSSNGNHSYFDTGAVNGDYSRMDVVLRQEEDPRWACSHAMAVHNAIVTEARLCLMNKDTATAVNNLVDQLVARLPQ